MWTRVYFNFSTAMFDLFITTKRQDYIIKDKTETNQASILILWHSKCTFKSKLVANVFNLYILQIKLAFVQKEVRDCLTYKMVSSERSWMHHMGKNLLRAC